MAIVLYLFLYRNFWEYVNIVELNKLDALVSALEEIYEINNNWDLLRNNPKKWHETIFLVLIQGRPKGSHITNLIKIITEKNYILKSEHLPIYKASFEYLIYCENIVKGFSRYHKYTPHRSISFGIFQ